jgi:hypothetical protein
MNPLTLLLVLFASMGVLLAAISIPLIRRRIKPNYWYGFRTRRTLSDPAVWYDVNAYAGKRLLISGIIATVTAIGLYFMPHITVDGYTLGMAVFALGPLTIGIWQSFRYLDRLNEQRKP